MPASEPAHGDDHERSRKRVPETSGQSQQPVEQYGFDSGVVAERARSRPDSISHSDVVRLQRTVGNRSVGQLLRSVSSAVASPALGIQRMFTSLASRDRHFNDHGSDFGSSDAAAYSKAADAFYAKRASYQSKVSGGKTYVYDSATDTFGSYNADGKTITFFKPCHNNPDDLARNYGQKYFDKQ